MTAPFAPPPSRTAWFIFIGLLAVVVAMPFARRDDLLGWLSLFVLAGFAVALWGILIVAVVRACWNWYRDKPVEPDDPKVGECYTDCIYSLSWDHDSFALRVNAGNPLIQVPLAKTLDVIDLEALILEEEVKFSTASKEVAFARSRSARFKLVKLIGQLARDCREVRDELERRSRNLSRQSAKWFAISLLTLAVLIVLMPESAPPNAFVALLQVIYALGWYWLLWRLAYSLACFFGSRKLRAMLPHESKPRQPV